MSLISKPVLPVAVVTCHEPVTRRQTIDLPHHQELSSGRRARIASFTRYPLGTWKLRPGASQLTNPAETVQDQAGLHRQPYLNSRPFPQDRPGCFSDIAVSNFDRGVNFIATGQAMRDLLTDLVEQLRKQQVGTIMALFWKMSMNGIYKPETV